MPRPPSPPHSRQADATPWRPRSRRPDLIRGIIYAAVVAMAASGPVSAQQAATLNGPPVQVQPTAMEPGVPAIEITTGALNPFPGAGTGAGSVTDPGSSIDAGTTGGGGGGGSGSGFVAASWSQYSGQAVGSGQCVALVQAADPSVGLTATWKQGAQVQGDASLTPGTAIATFNANGQYANALDGSSHAAIYLGQDSTGIQVLDQWAGSPAAYRTIHWSSATGLAANTGGSFYVISHAS